MRVAQEAREVDMLSEDVRTSEAKAEALKSSLLEAEAKVLVYEALS